MAFTRETLDDLRGELQRLNGRIMAITEVLGEGPAQITAAPPAKRRRRRKSPSRRSGEARGRPLSPLDQLVQSTAVANPGLGPAAIAEKIKGSGFKYEGKTPLTARVTGDVRRLVKRGLLKSRKGKYYPVGK